MPSGRAFAASLALHLLVVMVLLIPEKVWRGFRFYMEPSAADRRVYAKATVAAQPVETTKLPPAGVGFGGQYDGVILWPKEEKKAPLVPPMPAVRPNLLGQTERQPFTIPFFGVYWLFKAPDFRPPPNSLTAYGRPVELTFRSTDFRPLVMEAHQALGRRISLGCCREIQVAISNGDPISASIEMEVRLTDLTAKGSPSLSLGRSPVQTQPDDTSISTENVSFPIPAVAPITHFDEIAIEFHLHPRRSNRSPKIAVERFLFLPRN